MKDYSKMSDFEVNKAVIAFSCAYADVDIVQHPHHADGVSVGLYRACGDYYEWFDYCNSPSDAWTIIIENSITFNYDTAQVHVGSYFSDTAKVSENRNKALRAAMIVYLMMKDEE